jgi:GNAT superfamily N-acetyltransferase
MTAIHSVVPGRVLESGVRPRATWPIRAGELHRPIAALQRSAQFWAGDEPDERPLSGVPPLPVDDDSPGAPWLIRRPTRRPALAPFDSGPPAVFVELRGPDELAAANRVVAEAFGSDEDHVAPRRISLPPEPLHLRTWALFWEASVLSCARSVVVGDVVVLCAVATRPALQGRGLGSRMVSEVHRVHEQMGVVREFVACASLVAVSIFERLGYDPVMDRQLAAAAWKRDVAATRAERGVARQPALRRQTGTSACRAEPPDPGQQKPRAIPQTPNHRVL